MIVPFVKDVQVVITIIVELSTKRPLADARKSINTESQRCFGVPLDIKTFKTRGIMFQSDALEQSKQATRTKSAKEIFKCYF